MAESVDELAQIIKDYAKRHRKVSDRVAALESRVFGGKTLSKERNNSK